MSQNVKKNILIVEDDEMVRAFVTIHLENEGFQVTGVATGKAFFAAVEKNQVDLIILDLNLPDGDGLDFANEFRKTASTPIIIASTRKGMDDRLTALNLGSVDYVTKPFDPQELYLRILNLLNVADTQADDSEKSTAVEGGKLQTKYLISGILAAVLLIVVAGAAWKYGKSTPKIAGPTEVSVQPPEIVPEVVTVQPKKLKNPPVKNPPVKKPPVKKPDKCDEIPHVDWWSNKDHLSIRNYVVRKYAGNWIPYVRSWNSRLEKLIDIMGRNSSAITNDGIILHSSGLEDYIDKVEKRVAVLKCLAKKDGQKIP